MITHFTTLSDLGEAGPSYMYNFMLDYDAFIRLAGVYVPAKQVLHMWTCIPPSQFETLQINDVFYYGPRKMVCVTEPFETSEGELVIEANGADTVGNNPTEFILCGDAYSECSPWSIHPHEYVRHLVNEQMLPPVALLFGEGHRKDLKCQKALLITKTKAQTN